MKKNELKPDFKFSYAYLHQLGDTTKDLLTRDETEFADRGFTADKLAELNAARETFADFSTDEQLDGMRQDATNAKTNARNDLETKMRTVLVMAKNKFFETSLAKYREFGNSDLSRQSDNDLVRTGRAMAKTATKYMANLADEGLTTATVTALGTATKLLDDALDMQLQTVRDRDIATEARVIAGNTLYALIVKHSTTGRDIWIETSEAKYNDYVIYNTPGGVAEDGPVKEGGTKTGEAEVKNYQL